MWLMHPVNWQGTGSEAWKASLNSASQSKIMEVAFIFVGKIHLYW